MKKTERRFYPIDTAPLRLERRGEGDEAMTILRGMAPPYNAWSPIYGDWQERIAPGAFAESDADALATWEHDNAKIIGRESAGTLSIEDREDGSYWTVEMGKRSYELDLIESIERGEVKGASFEFLTVEDKWEKTEDDGREIWQRTVMWAERHQVGPVASPFYPDSTVALRSLERAEGVRLEERKITGPPAEFYERRQALLQRRLDIGAHTGG
ncbi:MAG: HK97 family phage prohead protease [Gemmatimonadetes bacterium]|nr:HK97 family phage prohead protease [Gemmatimonadota bacterium]